MSTTVPVSTIPGADVVKVSEFEVVPDPSGASVVILGGGRPIVLSFSKERTFAIAGKMLAACANLDRGQVVAMLQEVSARGGLPPAPSTQAPQATQAATPAASQDRLDFGLDDVLDLAAALQQRVHARGDIDASLLPTLLTSLLTWRSQTVDQIAIACEVITARRTSGDPVDAGAVDSDDDQVEGGGGSRG